MIIFIQILVDAQPEAGHVKAGFLSAEWSLDKDFFLGEIELTYSALADRFFTTEPPGKPYPYRY